jgi:cell division protein FtsB
MAGKLYQLRRIFYTVVVQQNIISFWKQNKKQLTDVRNIVLYLFAVIVLAITWSTIKAIQTNYQLEKQVSLIKQQNTVLDLQNQTVSLHNQYLQTDTAQELSARQNLGLAGPGEQVFLVPKAVALKYVNPKFSQQKVATKSTADTRSKYIKNVESWRDFLLGRKANV